MPFTPQQRQHQLPINRLTLWRLKWGEWSDRRWVVWVIALYETIHSNSLVYFSFKDIEVGFLVFLVSCQIFSDILKTTLENLFWFSTFTKFFYQMNFEKNLKIC